MGLIKLQYVVSFSSQDKKCPAENLLNSSSLKSNKYWLSSPDDKSGRLEVEFQLERITYIHYIDIGNYGSSTVEILVGRSSWPRSKDYVSLLPAVNFMTASDYKNNTSHQSVRMFRPDDLNLEATKEQWDRVRIICTQLYRKDVQFGLSFIRFLGKENSSPRTPEVKFTPSQFYSNTPQSESRFMVKSNGDIFKESEIKHSGILSRGKQLLQASAARSSTSGSTLHNGTPKSSKTSNGKWKNNSESFETEVLLFLTSRNQHVSTAEECLKEFEKFRSSELTEKEAQKFFNVFCVVSSTKDTNKDEQNHRDSPDTTVDYSDDEARGVRHPSRKRLHVKKLGSIENIDAINTDDNTMSFDINFSPKRPRINHSPSEHVTNHLSNGISKSSSESNGKQLMLRVPPVYDLDSGSASASNGSSSGASASSDFRLMSLPRLNGSYPNSPRGEFEQFDGSIPSTSKDVAYVDCPVCDKPFHVTEIETHAATCENWCATNKADSSSDDDDDDDVVFTASSKPCVPHKKCSTESYVECPLCGNMFHQDTVAHHANICSENCAA